LPSALRLASFRCSLLRLLLLDLLAPLLPLLRARPPDGAVGATLSGSGPSVVVWARKDRAADVARELERSLPEDTTVLALGIAGEGARIV